VGQLFGGDSSCTNTTGSNVYGRFDQAYSAALSTWLGASSTSSSTCSR
jgi:lysyl endopeptidase